jgi:hypothetical protein
MHRPSFSVSNTNVRQFAALCLLLGGGLSLWQWFAHGNVFAAWIWGVLALTIGPLGLVYPGLVKPVYVLAMFAAFPVGWLVSHVLLALLYFGIFTPFALVGRWRGRDALQLRFDPARETYWQDRNPALHSRRYLRQF